jgi:peptidoglycan/LPS O-acetylase OafA/YrhL
MSDSYQVWSAKDLILTGLVCSLATLWIVRGKSRRELVGLLAAAIILIAINLFIAIFFAPNTWRDWLPLVDLMYWTLTIVFMAFNRAIKRGGSSKKQNQSVKPQQ